MSARIGQPNFAQRGWRTKFKIEKIRNQRFLFNHCFINAHIIKMSPRISPCIFYSQMNSICRKKTHFKTKKISHKNHSNLDYTAHHICHNLLNIIINILHINLSVKETTISIFRKRAPNPNKICNLLKLATPTLHLPSTNTY